MNLSVIAFKILCSIAIISSFIYTKNDDNMWLHVNVPFIIITMIIYTYLGRVFDMVTGVAYDPPETRQLVARPVSY
jgi:hypothetical protein